jgi:hypothetical protein
LLNWQLWGFTRLFKALELCSIAFEPKFGDCLIAIGSKP